MMLLMQLDNSFKEFSSVFYILQGTNFELDSLMQFNMRSAASPYYMTLVARLPSSGLQQIFQVLVEEERLGILDLTCPISRPQGKGCFVDTLINFTTFNLLTIFDISHRDRDFKERVNSFLTSTFRASVYKLPRQIAWLDQEQVSNSMALRFQ